MQPLLRRRPPDLLVMMERADNWVGGEEDGEVGAGQVREEALHETGKRGFLRRQELDGRAVVAGLEELGVDAGFTEGAGHPGGGAEVELEGPVALGENPRRPREAIAP